MQTFISPPSADGSSAAGRNETDLERVDRNLVACRCTTDISDDRWGALGALRAELEQPG